MVSTPEARAHRVEFEGEALTLSRVGSALEVCLHRDPCNEIGTTMLAELERVAAVIEADRHGARGLLFWSDRKGFSAGADLRELQAGLVERRDALLGSSGSGRGSSSLGRKITRKLRGLARRRLSERVMKGLGKRVVRFEIGRFLDRIHRVFDTFDAAPILTVAATHGVVFGGGFELALTCDVRIAEPSARFCFPELRLGLIPGFGGIPRLERDVGNAVIRDLLLSGRSLNAKRAHSVGLVSQVVGPGKAAEAGRRLIEASSRFDAETVRQGKRFSKPIPRARIQEEKAQFLKMVTQPHVLEALTKFAEDDGVRPYV